MPPNLWVSPMTENETSIHPQTRLLGVPRPVGLPRIVPALM